MPVMMRRRPGIGSVGVCRDRKRLVTSGTLVAHLSRRLKNCVEHPHPIHLQQARIRLSERYGLNYFERAQGFCRADSSHYFCFRLRVDWQSRSAKRTTCSVALATNSDALDIASAIEPGRSTILK